MNRIVAALLVACAPAAVRADPAEVPAVEPSALPPACRAAALVPSDARSMAPTEAADIAAANCAAQAKLGRLAIAPTPAAAEAISEAVRPSLGLLEAVVIAGDPAARAIAKHAEADLYEGVAVRLLASVPDPPSGAVGEAVRAHAQLVERAARMARPWQRRAAIAYRETEALVDGLPEALRRDPVVGFAAGDARFEQRGPKR